MSEPCARCGRAVSAFAFCDEDAGGPWCFECFASTACGRGEHDEGCATKVFEGAEDLPPGAAA